MIQSEDLGTSVPKRGVSTKNKSNASPESDRADDTVADWRFRTSTMTFASQLNSSYDRSSVYQPPVSVSGVFGA